MSDEREHIDTSEASEFTTCFPTMLLRRNRGGNLQQLFVTDHYVRHDFVKRTEEWRTIPYADEEQA